MSARPARLVLFVALLAPAAGWAKHTGNDVPVCRQGFIEVVTPDAVTPEQCAKAAQAALAAWTFDEQQMHWGGGNIAPLTLRLISDERMDVEWPGGTRAYSEPSGVRFDMRTTLIDDPSAPVTLSHELGHVQSYRMLRSKPAKKEIPSWFMEGHGLLLNRLYAKQIGFDNPKGWPRWPKMITTLTAGEVRGLFADPRGEGDPKRNDKLHGMGLYLVEYLHGPRRIADVLPRIGRIFVEVGRGESFETAFQNQIGLPLSTVIGEIVALFERTAAAPYARLEGTRFLEWAGESVSVSPAGPRAQ